MSISPIKLGRGWLLKEGGEGEEAEVACYIKYILYGGEEEDMEVGGGGDGGGGGGGGGGGLRNIFKRRKDEKYISYSGDGRGARGL